MSLYTLKKISELHVRLTGKYIKKLIEGDITVGQYLGFSDRIDRSAMLIAKTFNCFDDFKDYLEANHPATAEEAINHELEHHEVGEKYGLKKITFGLIEDKNTGEYQPLLIDHLGENCRGWSKERLLKYLKDSCLGVSDPSEGDLEIIEALNSAS